MKEKETYTHADMLDWLAATVARAKREGLDRAVMWEYVLHSTDRARLAFDLFLVRTGDSLAYEAGSPESRFRERVRRMLALTQHGGAE